MHGNISLVKKLLYCIPIIPVYIVIFIVVYAFHTEVMFDKYGVTILKIIFVPIFEFFAIFLLL